MVYDAARQEMILFGGWTRETTGDGNVYPDELWAWDGEHWRRRDPPPGTPRPVGRDVPVLAYDAGRQRVVMFGGRRDSTPDPRALIDVWEWDGTRWYRIAATGLPRLLHPTAIYDPARKRVVVYGGGIVGSGGAFAGFSRTVWEWDGSHWLARDTTGPVGRFPGGSSSTPTGSLIFMTDQPPANRDAPRAPSETWIWNGRQWTHAEDGPAFNNLQAVAGAPDGTLYFYQSWETWLQSPTLHVRSVDGTWRHIELPVNPGIRNTAAAAWDARRKRLVVYGGVTRDRRLLDDTWEYDGRGWVKR
jgi:hypothetical protein